jgi:putative ABC transport system substrate-binding protein
MTSPRHWILVALAAAVVVAPCAWAEPARVVVVKSRALPAYDAAEQGFTSVVASQGQVSAKEYVLSGDPAVTRQVVAQITSNPPDVVLALGTEAAQQVGKAVGNIPVVFAIVVDPVQSDLLSNPSRPGGNMTGVSLLIPAADTLGALQRAAPHAKRIGIIYDPSNSQRSVKEMTDAARAAGLQVVARPVRSASEVPRAAEELRGKIDALYAPVDGTVYSPQSARHVLLFAVRNAIPVAGFSSNLVAAGALLALYPDYTDIGRQAGYIALRVLLGEAPGRIPVAAPRKSLLALNLNVARTLGLTIPSALRDSADKVYS